MGPCFVVLCHCRPEKKHLPRGHVGAARLTTVRASQPVARFSSSTGTWAEVQKRLIKKEEKRREGEARPLAALSSFQPSRWVPEEHENCSFATVADDPRGG